MLKPVLSQMMNSSISLSHKILELMGHALKLEARYILYSSALSVYIHTHAHTHTHHTYIHTFLPIYSSVHPSVCMSLTLTTFSNQDPLFFVKHHQKMGRGYRDSYSTLRNIHYPPIPPDWEVKQGQCRCGEHVDGDSITLIYQDPTGGLQVRRNLHSACV